MALLHCWEAAGPEAVCARGHWGLSTEQSGAHSLAGLLPPLRCLPQPLAARTVFTAGRPLCAQPSLCQGNKGLARPLLGPPPTALWTRAHTPLDQQPARKLQLSQPQRPAALGREPSAKDSFPPPRPCRSSWRLRPAAFSPTEHWVPKASPVASEHPPAHRPLAPTLWPEASPRQDSRACRARGPPAWTPAQELSGSQASPSMPVG